jgi:hypothetical protein
MKPIFTCVNCKWYEPNLQAPLNTKIRSGWCHRFPPMPAVIPVGPGQLGVQSNFPPVTDRMWCGEFSGDLQSLPTPPAPPRVSGLVPVPAS